MPEGVFRLGVFTLSTMMATMGHDRFRDYLLELKPCARSMEQLNPNANAPPDGKNHPHGSAEGAELSGRGIPNARCRPVLPSTTLKMGRNGRSTPCPGRRCRSFARAGLPTGQRVATVYGTRPVSGASSPPGGCRWRLGAIACREGSLDIAGRGNHDETRRRNAQ